MLGCAAGRDYRYVVSGLTRHKRNLHRPRSPLSSMLPSASPTSPSPGASFNEPKTMQLTVATYALCAARK